MANGTDPVVKYSCCKLLKLPITSIPPFTTKNVKEYLDRLSLVRAVGPRGISIGELIDGLLNYTFNLLPHILTLKSDDESTLLTTCKAIFELTK